MYLQIIMYLYYMKIWDIVKEDFEKPVDEDWKKNLAATAIAASTMLGGKGQSTVPTNQPKPAIQQVAPKKISVDTMQQWNNYIMWLKNNKLSGDKRMNNVAFSKQTLADYNKQNPNSTLTYDLVKPIQAQIKAYRQSIIDAHKSGAKINFSTPPGDDYSGFMPWATGTTEDGINGEYTSQFMFPKTYLTNLNTGVKTDLGFSR